jgi:membrane protein DedA with SNARE-associated domain
VIAWTSASFAGWTAGAGGSALAQGIAAALATFILEDVALVGSGLLVADGRLGFGTALAGVSIGIALGDLGLYAIGRYLGPKCLERGWISQRRFDVARSWLTNNLAATLFASRCVPGSRLPTLVGAGVLKAPAWRFGVLTSLAAFVWTLAILALTRELGEAVLPLLGRAKWIAAGVLLTVLGVWHFAGSRRRKARERLEDAGAPMPQPEEKIVSFFEFWPPWLFYIPVAVHYAGLALKHRSATLPTCANPSIYSGGMIRESKSEILGLVPEEFRRFVPRWTTFQKSTALPIDLDAQRARQRMRSANLDFPLVAKPDQGQRGAGVRLLRSESDLVHYLENFPEGVPFLLQELADYPAEAGIFYVRRPGDERGRILSVTLKHFPKVQGDGRRPLRELILADPRARIVQEIYFARHVKELDRVLADGEAFRLVFAGNHCQGAIFKDGRSLVTPELEARFDEIARSMPDFYFGRFDARFQDEESFRRGENFKIVEINGAGAEVTHIWDAQASLLGAYRDLFEQFRLLFEIGAANRARGVRPLGPIRFLADAAAYFRVSRGYPPAT